MAQGIAPHSKGEIMKGINRKRPSQWMETTHLKTIPTLWTFLIPQCTPFQSFASLSSFPSSFMFLEALGPWVSCLFALLEGTSWEKGLRITEREAEWKQRSETPGQTQLSRGSSGPPCSSWSTPSLPWLPLPPQSVTSKSVFPTAYSGAPPELPRYLDPP